MIARVVPGLRRELLTARGKRVKISCDERCDEGGPETKRDFPVMGTPPKLGHHEKCETHESRSSATELSGGLRGYDPDTFTQSG
jgi:hypothetical protein